MCGINGIWAYGASAPPLDPTELLATREHMAMRGPDACGHWIAADARIGLAHRRLSIIDLTEAGAQPMVSEDGELAVVFNGEIYNHETIRRQLEQRGRRFRSRSDTEVLLHLYAEKGADMVDELRGMFAFAIWDSARAKLLLARDPYGIKPLYYADDRRTFRFASQVKALLEGGAIARDVDAAGVVGFHMFGSVPEPLTMYRSIRALPAGHVLSVGKNGAGAPRQFHSISAVYADAEWRGIKSLSHADRQAAARDALLDSVRHHLVADVQVGASCRRASTPAASSA